MRAHLTSRLCQLALTAACAAPAASLAADVRGPDRSPGRESRANIASDDDAATPGPKTYALLMAGIGVAAFISRHRQTDRR